MESLTGKTAIVTGGTRGIGRAIAERLLQEGVAVAICGRDLDALDRAVKELSPLGRIYGHRADVTSIEQVRELFSAVDREFSGLDILVNNAGAGVFRKVAEMNVEDWHKNIDLNLNGVFYSCREALPRLIAKGGGSIVNISSLAGKNAFSGGAGYNAAKAGVNLFGESLMLDHRHDGIRVTCIMPGSVDTEFSGGPFRKGGDTSWMIAPVDVAEAVLFVLRTPSRTMISSIEIRPSRPKK